MNAQILPAGPVVRLTSWFTVGILLLMAVLSYLDRIIIALLVTPIRQSLDITDFQLGLVQGLGFGIFYALFGVPIGYLVDRFSRRWILFLGTGCWSLAAAGCGLANSFSQLFMARVAVGVGEAALSPAAYSIIADLFPKRRLSFAVSVFGVGTVLGSAVAFIGGGAAIRHFESIGAMTLPVLGVMEPWQIVLILTGLPGLLVAPLIFLVREPGRTSLIPVMPGDRPADDAPLDDRKETLTHFLRRSRTFLSCHFIGFGLLAAATYGGLSWLPTMLMRRFDTPIADIGLMMGLVSIFAGVPGFLASGWIVDRWFHAGTRDAHQRYYAIVNLIAAAVCIPTFLVAPSAVLAIVGWGIISLVQPFTGPSAAQLQIVTPPHLRGRVSALYVMIFNLMGMCIGPPLVGFLTDYVLGNSERIHVALAFSYFGLAGASALCFWIGLGPSRRAMEGA
ncbi:spinster family MFS transporter [Pacificimonas sp. ICDLI1SI03]